MDIFKDVKRIAFDYKYKDRVRTITMAHIYGIVHAIDNSDFPLLLLEDDARIRKPLPEAMNIPDKCSLIYLGGSNYNCGDIKPNMYLTDYDIEYYRVYYIARIGKGRGLIMRSGMEWNEECGYGV